jgi:hypothetical protein
VLDRNQRRNTAPGDTFASHHWAKIFRRDHHSIDIPRRLYRFVNQAEAGSEKKRLTTPKRRRDLPGKTAIVQIERMGVTVFTPQTFPRSASNLIC